MNDDASMPEGVEDFANNESLLEEEESDESSQYTESEEEPSWISWFTSLRGNDFFCTVDEEYIQDDFNLTGLSSMVPFYDYALDMILDVEIPLEKLNEEEQDVVETAAEVLYGLIHSRYILTSKGMQRMYDKFQKFDFGRCPRVFCQGQAVLPVGLSDQPRNYSVNVFCPKCHQLFYPRSTKHAGIDGAYFGTTFAHLFLMLNTDIIPRRSSQSYAPRIYGFRIHKSSDYFQQWCVPEERDAVGTNVPRSDNNGSKDLPASAADFVVLDQVAASQAPPYNRSVSNAATSTLRSMGDAVNSCNTARPSTAPPDSSGGASQQPQQLDGGVGGGLSSGVMAASEVIRGEQKRAAAGESTSAMAWDYR